MAGTIHLLKPTLLPLPAVYDEVFRRADRLALEINPLLFTDPKRIAKIQTITHVDKKEVKDAMSRKLRTKAIKFLRSLGATKDTVFSTSPGMLSTQIELIKLNSLGYNINAGVDAAYARQGSVEGKAILEVDIHQLYALSRKDLDNDPVLKPIADRLYDERNLGMFKQIEIYLTQPETTTLMVGAGHYGGPKGLATLLTEKGYLEQQLNHSGEPI